MLTTEQIRAHLAKITYKPGWEFLVYDGEWEGQHLVIKTVVPNSYDQSSTQVLDVHSALPPMPDFGYLERWLAWRLIRIESHEAREFLRKDGRPIFDPHAENAERDNPDYDPTDVLA